MFDVSAPIHWTEFLPFVVFETAWSRIGLEWVITLAVDLPPLLGGVQ